MYSLEEVKKATMAYFGNDELATNVFISKYCLRDQEGNFIEKTPDEMHRRMAKEFARIEGYFDTEDGLIGLKEEEIYSYFKDFKYIVPQGSPMMGIGNDYVNVSLSNCVVVESPEDNISSIFDAGKDLANLFKRRCGVGIDISSLRPEGTAVNNAARTTTGAWSFSDFYSYVCRLIGQNGRRGALMVSIDVRHPDIFKFVKMKQDLSKVTGANVSVKITDDFMDAVLHDDTFTLHFPVGSENPSHTKEIKATELWKVIVESATENAEPGLLMWDNIIKNLPAHCYPAFKTVTTNPCGEIPLSAYDSCRLISLNLKHLVENPFSPEARFDFSKFEEIASVGMRLSDDLVELELEKLETIRNACDTPDEKELWEKLLNAALSGRRTGLGTHGLADVLARLGLAYDSPDALKITEKIYETLRNTAYIESSLLAQERGEFPAFNWDLEKDNEFIKRLPARIQEMIKLHGRRNISILTSAPTGSVSIMSQTSSGLEPVFRNWYIRRRKLSHNEQDAVEDFTDDLGDRWVEYRVFHHNLQEYLDLTKSTVIPDFFVESDSIDWEQRVLIQAAIQRSIDHSISSTINLPKGTDSEVVASIYEKGWMEGLKGITVYVEGSREGVLLTERESSVDLFPQHSAPKRPLELPCNLHHTTIDGEKWIIVVGLMDGKPYEVMGGRSDLIEIPRGKPTGFLIKNGFKTKNSVYDLKIGVNGDTIIVKDLVKAFANPDHSAFTRLISLSLRHGADIKYVVEQMQKDRDSSLHSFARCIARILKNYIVDGVEASEKTCGECHTDGLIYVEGCVTCTNCGFSKCS